MKAISIAVFFLITLTVLPAQASDWRSTNEGTFTFEIKFEGVGAPGDFKRFDVDMKFNPKNPRHGELRVVVDLAGADMGDPDMNAGIADADWFHVDEHPKAIFESKSIKADRSGQFVAKGTLNLKGVSKPVTVPFSWSENRKHANIRGELIVQRTDFNVGSGEWASADPISIDVNVKFDVVLQRVD